ncbi:MAG: glycoside hydrolase family 65 protein [Anaerolineae bacterium]
MDNWHIVERSFNPAELHHRETVFSIGNGYLGTRGTFEEGYPGDWPMTFIHGLFDDVPIFHTELVNVPNWLYFTLRVGGERFRMDRGALLDYRRVLDMSTGAVGRMVRWRSPAGRTVDIRMEHFASLADKHITGVRYRVTPLDFEGTLEFCAGIFGHVHNDHLLHWEHREQGSAGTKDAYLLLRTLTSNIALCEASHLEVNGSDLEDYLYRDCPWVPSVIARARVQQGQPVIADKLVTVYTSREVEDPRQAALKRLTEATEQGYDELFTASADAWAEEWERSNVVIEGDDDADRALRYNLFQLLSAAPRQDDRVSIPAKGLSGLGYRGHVFWDTEIFMLPFFTYTQPHIARNLLMYRYHTLPGARKKAEESGYEGAMYAWESAVTGEETTPRWVFGPDEALIRIWTGDIEPHISADVAYGVYQYWQVTGDDAFMRDYGAEIMLDTAKFWVSRVEWNRERGIYEITDVIGPDEYHDHVDNNAYTNEIARWNVETALEVLAWLRRTYPEKAQAVEEQLLLTEQRLRRWADVIGCLYHPLDPETGLMEQFEGFFDLEDVNPEEFEPREQSWQALLGIEGVQAYQLLKQPDVLMLLYLLPERYPEETFQVNWDYYTPRTDLTYGSSLGPAIQAALSAQMGEEDRAYQHFIHAAQTDLEDARGNASDGIHAAAAGGLWQAAIFGFGGLRLTPDGPVVEPHLPGGWARLKFRIQYQGEMHEYDIRSGSSPLIVRDDTESE